MGNGKGAGPLLTITLLLLAASLAQANPVGISSYSCTGAQCNSVDWSHFSNGTSSPAGTSVPTSQAFQTALGGTDFVTVSFSDALNGVILSQGASGPNGFSGGTGGSTNFAAGELLLSNNDVALLGDTVTLTFTKPVSAIGLILDNENYQSAYSATISTNSDGGGSSTVASPGTNGGAVFLGLSDTTADITSVTFSTTQTGAGATPDFFVLGTAFFNEGTASTPPVTTPEPGSMLMVGGGLAAVAWKLRKRRTA